MHTYVNGSHLQCVRCTVDDGVTCDQICAPGRFRVRGTDQCLPCTLSPSCQVSAAFSNATQTLRYGPLYGHSVAPSDGAPLQVGYFSAACSGNTTSDAACVPCAPPIASHMHVPYSAQRTDYSARVSQVRCGSHCGSLCGSAEATAKAATDAPAMSRGTARRRAATTSYSPPRPPPSPRAASAPPARPCPCTR